MSCEREEGEMDRENDSQPTSLIRLLPVAALLPYSFARSTIGSFPIRHRHAIHNDLAATGLVHIAAAVNGSIYPSNFNFILQGERDISGRRSREYHRRKQYVTNLVGNIVTQAHQRKCVSVGEKEEGIFGQRVGANKAM